MKCINCGMENQKDVVTCENCGSELNFFNSKSKKIFNEIDYNRKQENVSENSTVTQEVNVHNKKVGCLGKAIMGIMALPFLLIGLMFVVVSCYAYIKDQNQSKNYVEIVGTLKEYKNCDSDGLCEAIYEYSVDGITYEVSPKMTASKSEFKETEQVKYNPNNPSESLIVSKWSFLFITGILIFIVTILVIVGLYKKIKKVVKGMNNLKFYINKM